MNPLQLMYDTLQAERQRQTALLDTARDALQTQIASVSVDAVMRKLLEKCPPSSKYRYPDASELTVTVADFATLDGRPTDAFFSKLKPALAESDLQKGQIALLSKLFWQGEDEAFRKRMKIHQLLTETIEAYLTIIQLDALLSQLIDIDPAAPFDPAAIAAKLCSARIST